MTRKEVRDILGDPHKSEIYPTGEECWYYYRDAFQLDIVGLSFKDGRLQSWWED
jgi:hypothetical protein